jgi:hypothetical protein
MIDWYMLLAPLVVLPIVMLFGFVGCSLEQHGEADPTTITLFLVDPPKTYWPAAHKVTFSVTITSEKLTYQESQSLSSTSLEQPPDSFPLEMPLSFYAPSHQVLDCYVDFTGHDASGIKIGSALPPCYPGPCKKTIDSDGDGPHWRFKAAPTDLQYGANKIVKIVDIT